MPEISPGSSPGSIFLISGYNSGYSSSRLHSQFLFQKRCHVCFLQSNALIVPCINSCSQLLNVKFCTVAFFVAFQIVWMFYIRIYFGFALEQCQLFLMFCLCGLTFPTERLLSLPCFFFWQQSCPTSQFLMSQASSSKTGYLWGVYFDFILQISICLYFRLTDS